MKSRILLLLLLAFSIACGGPVVEIPPAHVGKLSTGSGLQEGILYPKKMRLQGLCRICDSLIMVEAIDHPIKDSMVVYIPADELNIDVDTRGIVSISNDESNIDKIFDKILPDLKISNRVSKITMKKVHHTYGEPIIREIVRTILTRNGRTIKDIMINREAISVELFQAIRKKLIGTPLTIKRFGLANVQPPPVILTAKIAAKKREIEIEQEEADKMIRITKASGDFEVAVKQQLVDLKEAETQVLVQAKLNGQVNRAFVTQRGFKALMTLAQSDNKVFILPREALTNPAMLIGMFQDGFNFKSTVKNK